MLTKSGKARVFGASLLLAAGAAVAVGGGSASAVPPGIPDAETARSELSSLTVAPDGSMDGYDRDLFPHWSSVEGNCNTREMVLRRDGDGVEVGTDCYPTSGTWTSPYDGDTWSEPSDVDIDHMVPLAAAWRSGASEWTTAEREAFANDLSSPQLWAVTDNVNQSKGDQTPEAWKPPLESHWCEYARAYTHVKYVYDLTVNSAEQGALSDMLGTC
ncbi:HNH endonuclease family protein [Actinophytocola gossypii]|uniref:HNH endonuclease n=1 Tax=Actinophytocola gossypii TaxID=2812003 RepID=A0ABT2JDQ6_9PSEU|nr:HNH endonuclease family protein [Actinophytocola gossypii]MCT2586011.1 HNH endonuclease [Actinophytocola gossypii]